MSDVLIWAVGGDLGDSFVSLQLLHALGGKHVVRFVDREKTKIVDRVPLIKDLFEAQDYVERTEISDEPPDIDLTEFRRWHSSTTYLGDAQTAEFCHQTGRMLNLTYKPWLKVEPDTKFAGKVIIARSDRYQNLRFNPIWTAIIQHYGSRLIFVGLSEEHSAFCMAFGRVPHMRVNNFLEMARAMAGCSLVVANQSSPHALALGLGCNIIQETCDWQPDVIVNRDNVKYVCDGEVTLPDVAGSGELYIPPVPDIPEGFSTSLVPPGYWQWKGLPASTHFGLQGTLVAQAEKCSIKEAEEMLFRHNALRCSEFFNGKNTSNDPMNLFHLAHRNAFHSQETVLKPII